MTDEWGARSGRSRLVEPFFFGPAGRRLYGYYHSAVSRSRQGVLLCPPIGHEAIQFHRVLRQLADMLARAGFDVLRFDYLGCGDSAGDETSWSLESWRRDVEYALEQLRRRSRNDEVAAVGLRLGASLVASHGASHGQLEAVVLWDPVTEGKAFLREQRAAHRGMLETAHVLPEAGEESTRRTEILGFGLPPVLERELASYELASHLERPPAERICLIESNPAASQQSLASHLRELGSELREERIANPHLWTWIEDFARVHVPHRILRTVVSWLAGEDR